jgi:hypothetical protein
VYIKPERPLRRTIGCLLGQQTVRRRRVAKGKNARHCRGLRRYRLL